MQRTELARFVDPSGRCSDPRLLVAIAAFHGARLASEDEFEAAQALAAGEVEGTIVTAAMFAEMQGLTQSSIFIVKEQGRITGCLAFFTLREGGVAALRAGQFAADAVDPNWVSRPGEAPEGVYAWGFAGRTSYARKAVVKASVTVAEAALWAVPAFTRIASADGERVLVGKMGFRRVPGDTTGLAMKPPGTAPFAGLIEEAAA